MTLIYVHGANSTPLSFAFFKEHMDEPDHVDFEYSVLDPVENAVNALIKTTREHGKAVDVVSHSLGGVIATVAARRGAKIRRLVTISSPFGGSRLASMLRWTHPCQLFDDIHVYSPFILEAISSPAPIDMHSIVTCAGSRTLFGEDNDGVVSVASQMALSGPHYKKIDLNHFEILLSREIVIEIKDYLLNGHGKKSKKTN